MIGGMLSRQMKEMWSRDSQLRAKKRRKMKPLLDEIEGALHVNKNNEPVVLNDVAIKMNLPEEWSESDF